MADEISAFSLYKINKKTNAKQKNRSTGGAKKPLAVSSPKNAEVKSNVLKAKANNAKVKSNANKAKTETTVPKQNGVAKSNRKPNGTTNVNKSNQKKNNNKNSNVNGGGRTQPKKISKNKVGVQSKSALTKASKAVNQRKTGSKTASTKTKVAATKATMPKKLNYNEKIGPRNLDFWVEVLYDDTKTLTKRQLDKKKELDDYMMRELEQSDSSNGAESDSGDETSSSDEDCECDCSDSNCDCSGHECEGSDCACQQSECDCSESDCDCEDDESTDDSDSGEEDEYTLNSYPSDYETDNEANDVASSTKLANEAAAKITGNAEKPKVQKRKSTSGNKNGIQVKKERTDNSIGGPNKKFNTNTTSEAKQTSSRPSTSTGYNSDVSNGRIKVETIVGSGKLEPPQNVVSEDSIAEGKRALAWIIQPLNCDEFIEKYWEKDACLIDRKSSDMFEQLISFNVIDKMLIENHLEFGKNIDVTAYRKGQRETLNDVGRAIAPTVWGHYDNGCSIRLLNPQAYVPQLHSLNAKLQEFFHCLVGTNVYLTPPNSQGFAPHYDDIEAFVLQVEGRKRWRLYDPIKSTDKLARESSQNFTQEEIGKPIFEEVLKPGDVLYFPRGTIHQASTEPGHHSLHITLSVYQKQAYADLLEKLMPLVLEKAINSSLRLRRGLPLHTFRNLGVAFNETESEERVTLQEDIKAIVSKHLVPSNDLIDDAIDEMAKKFQYEALPPLMRPEENARTIFGSRCKTNKNGISICDYELKITTNVRLIRAHITRLVRNNGPTKSYNLYYYVDNASEYGKYEQTMMEIEAQEAPVLKLLISSYPFYVSVSQFPVRNDERKITIATALWERGLLMTEKPFKEK